MFEIKKYLLQLNFSELFEFLMIGNSSKRIEKVISLFLAFR